MPWVVYVGSHQHPPEPLFKMQTRDQAARWVGRLQAMAAIKRLSGAEVFMRWEEDE